jgi:RNA polymerase sigma-70 factor (ECF subfamily)
MLSRDERLAAWIRRMGRGDIEAFGALYDETSTMIFSLVLQILPNRELAEDTLVDIYNRAREQARRFAPRKQSAADWLIALARDCAVERVRRSGLQRPPETFEEAFNGNRGLANIALAELPEEQRSILEMTYLGGLTVDEVANLVGASREYVAKQIVFGMRTLRAAAQNTSAVTVRISNFDASARFRRRMAETTRIDSELDTTAARTGTRPPVD